jgi:hypothetical protein
MIDFMNLKIKPTKSFRYAYRNIVYICVFICVSAYIYKYLRLYCISYKFLKR